MKYTGKFEIADNGNITILWKALKPEERTVFNFLRDNADKPYSLEEISEGVHSEKEAVQIILNNLLNLRAIGKKDDKYFYPK